PTTHSVYGSECDSLPITRGASTCPWVPVHRSRGERRRFPRTPADPGPRRTVRDRGESSVRQPLGPLPIEIRTSALLLRRRDARGAGRSHTCLPAREGLRDRGGVQLQLSGAGRLRGGLVLLEHGSDVHRPGGDRATHGARLRAAAPRGAPDGARTATRRGPVRAGGPGQLHGALPGRRRSGGAGRGRGAGRARLPLTPPGRVRAPSCPTVRGRPRRAR